MERRAALTAAHPDRSCRLRFLPPSQIKFKSHENVTVTQTHNFKDGVCLPHCVLNGPRLVGMDPSWLQYADPCSARDLTVEAAQSISKVIKGGSSAARNNISTAKLKALLDSRSDRDLLDGLKRVVAVWLIFWRALTASTKIQGR
jgi:hypothetical protein